MNLPYMVAAIYAYGEDYATEVSSVIDKTVPLKPIPVYTGSIIMIERINPYVYEFIHLFNTCQAPDDTISIAPKKFRVQINHARLVKLVDWLEVCIYSATNPDSAMVESDFVKLNPGPGPANVCPHLYDVTLEVNWNKYTTFSYRASDRPISFQWNICVSDAKGNPELAVWEYSKVSVNIDTATRILAILKHELEERDLIVAATPSNAKAIDEV